MLLKFQSVFPEENRFRFYTLKVDQNLFGFMVTISWGRIGSYARSRSLELDTSGEVQDFVRGLIKRRLAHRYTLVAAVNVDFPLSIAAFTQQVA